MIDWVAKKTDKDVKKDVDKVDEIVHDNNMTMSDALKVTVLLLIYMMMINLNMVTY